MKTLLLITTFLLSLSSYSQSLGDQFPQLAEAAERADGQAPSITDYSPIDGRFNMGLDTTDYSDLIVEEQRDEFGLATRDLDFLTSEEERDTNRIIRSTCSRSISDDDSGLNLMDGNYTLTGRNTNTAIGVDGDSLTFDFDHGCASGVGGARTARTSRFSVDPSGSARFEINIPLYGGNPGSMNR
jgi:hypothetical protein